VRFYISRYSEFPDQDPFDEKFEIETDHNGEQFIDIDMDKDTLSKIDFIVTKINDYGHEYRFMVQKVQKDKGVKWELILL